MGVRMLSPSTRRAPRRVPPGRPATLVALLLALGLLLPPTAAATARQATPGSDRDALLEGVGAAHYGDRPVGLLSGGEQQRLRVGQALADQPALLLCDEPLSNLDLANQRGVTDIIERQRREHDAAVLFVTHDINPILSRVDRILYIAGGRFVLGTPDEVLQSRVLTDLYGTPVFVLRAGDRLVVVGVPDAEPHHEHGDDDTSTGSVTHGRHA